MYNRERYARRDKTKCWRCKTAPTGAKRTGGHFVYCKPCFERSGGNTVTAEKRQDDAQDLSAFHVMARGERNGLRYVSFFAPWPAKTKHNRTALTAKPGFRPLVAAAKKYQQFIAQAVLVNDLIGWIREDTEYILEVITFGHRSDNDQYTGGLQDDLVKSGLMANDRHCEATVSRRLVIPKDQEKKLFVAVYETEKAEVQ